MKKMIFLISGIILFVWFMIPMVVTGNVRNIGNLTGLGISALLIIYGLFTKRIDNLLLRLWHTLAGRILEIIVLAICAVILGLAIATGCAMISAANVKAEPGSTVIVLGARVYKDRVSTALKSRLDAAYSYLEENPDSVCIVSGGQGDNEPCTESSLMYRYLLERGISEDRLYAEDRSVNTEENIRFSKAIIERNGLNPTVAIATDGYHEYRALKYAKEAFPEAGAIPAGTVWWLFPVSIIREMYGILEQWFLK